MNGPTRYATLNHRLAPGETLLVRVGALCHYQSGIALKAQTLRSALKGFFFIRLNPYCNKSSDPKELVLAPTFPGELMKLAVDGSGYCLAKQAILALTPQVKLQFCWAGWKSWWVGSGLFQLKAKGQGWVWVTGFGHLVQHKLHQPMTVDQGHLIGYESGTKLRRTFSGGVMASLLGKEGLVYRMAAGKGCIITQSKSPKALAEWHNSRLRY